MKCSFCGQEIEDIMVELNLEIYPFRKTEDEKMERVPNGEQASKEFLCKDCFSRFVDSISEHMEQGNV
jgi:DNA-directed RNA polymerase subunit RPC12/RpoP